MAVVMKLLPSPSNEDTLRCLITAEQCNQCVELTSSISASSNLFPKVIYPVSDFGPVLLTEEGTLFSALAICRFFSSRKPFNPICQVTQEEVERAGGQGESKNNSSLIKSYGQKQGYPSISMQWDEFQWLSWVVYTFDPVCDGPNEQPIISSLNLIEDHFNSKMLNSSTEAFFLLGRNFCLADVFVSTALLRNRFGRSFTFWPRITNYLNLCVQQTTVRTIFEQFPDLVGCKQPSNFFRWQNAASLVASMNASSHNLKNSIQKSKEKIGKFYLTTAINYTNGPPHIGHAYEEIVSDFISRSYRMFNYDVFFLTGTDEHGQKIANTAARQGLAPIEICNRYCKEFQLLNEKLSLSNDYFIRTSDPKHKAVCQWLWEQAKSAGDIYLGVYSGWYNEREETFLSDSDAKAINYVDTVTGLPLIKMDEESYFFKMSKYQERLVQHIQDNPRFILPDSRRKDILMRLKEPLHDLSCSRNTFEWGVQVPGDPCHVMYVWFDALTNYITAVDAPDGPKMHYWPADAHVIGKDIAWFHAVVWPCILMSAGIPLPKSIVTHGFVSAADGRKMSKSLGNVVDPNDVLQRYSSDVIRFYLLREARFGGEVRYDEDGLIDLSNSDLADVLGNLVHRAISLCQKFCGGCIPEESAPDTLAPFDFVKLADEVQTHLQNYCLDSMLESVMVACRSTNKYTTDNAPWLQKDPIQKRKTIRCILEAVYILAHFFEPVIPVAAERIFERLNTPRKTIPELSCWFNNLIPGTPIVADKAVLFEKIPLREATVALQKFELRVGKIVSVEPGSPENSQMGYVKLLVFDNASGNDHKDRSTFKCNVPLHKLQIPLKPNMYVVTVCNLKFPNSGKPSAATSKVDSSRVQLINGCLLMLVRPDGNVILPTFGDLEEKCNDSRTNDNQNKSQPREFECGSLVEMKGRSVILKNRDSPTVMEWENITFTAMNGNLCYESSPLILPFYDVPLRVPVDIGNVSLKVWKSG
ncbi:methionyl-tRna synthetase [Cardiosporidium cionae]|uniref:methionine--tRNA ligase n=1 Tax=Cardiosporidium cionae TaxID=476202 RepID=A0ABQ7JBP7_9APIC|nr:methionyl-tRna synthetase [Cardiosporidium cionae]|eukprot:KAF8821339.1 methionyl-tRna synthetase [Cardiosporidium cionae]